MKIALWHGSRGWAGRPEIRPSKKGRTELGPGIYVTTHFDTARQYAKGGGVVRKIILEPRLTLELAALSLCDAADFVTSVLPRSAQQDTLGRLVQCAERNKLENRVLLGSGGQHVHAEVLVNLCVNGDLLTAKKGPALAEFLVAQGIDCSFSRRSGNEYWGVIFNPEIITSYESVTPASVPLHEYELVNPYEQMSGKSSTVLMACLEP